jgi:hypothetical protein
MKQTYKSLENNFQKTTFHKINEAKIYIYIYIYMHKMVQQAFGAVVTFDFCSRKKNLFV